MDHVLCKLQSIIYNVNYLLFLFIYLFIFWLCWVFVSVRGLSLVAASGGHSSSRCAGLSLSWPLLLRSTGSRRTASVAVAHGHSCSAACGILPDQGSTRVPCIGRQTLNHCATREAPTCYFFHSFSWKEHRPEVKSLDYCPCLPFPGPVTSRNLISLFFFFFFLATLCGSRDHNSLTRD